MWNNFVILCICVGYVELCRFGPDSNCGFTCRCTGDNKCDAETGECVKGSQCQSGLPDGYGWQGKGCRIGNVAYGKPNVQQLQGYLHYTADLAVDGDTTPFISGENGESCAHPFLYTGMPNDQDELAWWWLDLGYLYNIWNITIVNRLTAPGTAQPQYRYNERSTNYDIKIGNASDISQQSLCFHQGKPGNEVQPVETFSCKGGDMVGRYVSFTRTGGTDTNQAAICEFIVMGHKALECDRSYCVGICDPVIGCDECTIGKMLPDCNEDCPVGRWGLKCAEQCGMCKPGVACEPMTGSCGEQCNGWYIPESCTEELSEVPFSANVDVSFDNDASAVVSWEVLEHTETNENLNQYFYCVLHYGVKNSDEDTWKTSKRVYLTELNGTALEYTLLSLEYYTEYTLQIVPHRAINGLVEGGQYLFYNFTTPCGAPARPPTPSIVGSPERFSVKWTAVDSSASGCEHMKSLELVLQCYGATHTTLETEELPWAATEFEYSSPKASSCVVWLVVTNNAGFSALSLTAEVTNTPVFNGKMTSIIVGTICGVIILILIVIIIFLVLRLRASSREKQEHQHENFTGKPNPVFENQEHQHHQGDDYDVAEGSKAKPPVVYESVGNKDNGLSKTAGPGSANTPNVSFGPSETHSPI